jgi:hypothetical protein
VNFDGKRDGLAAEQKGVEGEEHRWLHFMKAGQHASKDSRCAYSYLHSSTEVAVCLCMEKRRARAAAIGEAAT